MDRRLYRSRSDRVIGGVAGGLAAYLGVDPSLVRVAWVVLAVLTGGFFALVYLVMLFVVPEEPYPGAAAAAAGYASPEYGATQPGGTEPPAEGETTEQAWTAAAPATQPPDRASAPARKGNSAVIIGLILILVGGYFLLRQYIPQIDLDLIWPVVVIGVGVLLLVSALQRGRRSGD